MTKIKALIVDDEALARANVRHLLKREADIQIVGEADDGEVALRAIRELRPHLVFLDIQMPILGGLPMLARLTPAELPTIVFVTAYDKYALEAFELHAIDYLLKPFDDERFKTALTRAKRRIQNETTREALAATDRLVACLEQLPQAVPITPVAAATSTSTFVIKNEGEFHFIQQKDIRWIEAEGDFIRVHTTGQKFFTRMTLARALELLDPQKFVRIHKSTAINIDFIRRVKATTPDGQLIVLSDGTELNMSRTHKNKLGLHLDAALRRGRTSGHSAA